MINLTINGKPITAESGQTILETARANDIYIPSLCWHPGLDPVDKMKGSAVVFLGDKRIESDDPEAVWDGCGICAVEVNGEILRACATEATSGMVVSTDSSDIIAEENPGLPPSRLFDLRPGRRVPAQPMLDQCARGRALL